MKELGRLGKTVQPEELVAVTVREAEEAAGIAVSVREGETIKTVVAVLTNGQVAIEGEAELAIPPECLSLGTVTDKDGCEYYDGRTVLPIEQVLPTVVIAPQLFQEVLAQDSRLQRVMEQVLADFPQLQSTNPKTAI